MNIEQQIEQLDKRMVRMETRITSAIRALGWRPGATPEFGKAKVIYAEGAVHVSGLDAPVARVAEAAVKGCDGRTQDVDVYVLGQLWGTIRVHGKGETDE